MKGISPIVAAVLLIAITMTIAGVLAYWSQSFVSTTLPVENTSIAECRIAQFVFLSCRYNATGQSIAFSLNNIRGVNLGITAFIEYANGTISSGTSVGTLSSNTIKSFNVSGVSSDFTSLVIKTSCPDLSASTTCLR